MYSDVDPTCCATCMIDGCSRIFSSFTQNLIKCVLITDDQQWWYRACPHGGAINTSPSHLFLSQVSGSPRFALRCYFSPSPPASPCCRVKSVATVSPVFVDWQLVISPLTAVKVPTCRVCPTTSPTCWRKWHQLTKTLGKKETRLMNSWCVWQWDDTFRSWLIYVTFVSLW